MSLETSATRSFHKVHPSGKHDKPSTKSKKPNIERPAVATLRANVETTMKWFNYSKGYGFAKNPDGGKDIFVHKNVVQRAGIKNLVDGHVVMLDFGESKRGPEAIGIRLK